MTSLQREKEIMLTGDPAKDIYNMMPAAQEDLPFHVQRSRASARGKRMGSEDALQSYMWDLSQLGRSMLTSAEEGDLAQRAASGDVRAQYRLIESSLWLVIAIARHYTSPGVPLIDLIQEGNLGLMHAVQKFDYQRGFRFSTYAVWWIRRAVSRAVVEQAHLIHLPETLATHLRKVRRIAAQLTQENGFDPAPEQIAAASHLQLHEVIDLLGTIEQPESLDALLDEQTHPLAETMEDHISPTLDEVATQNLVSEALQRAMIRLTRSEQLVITLRYGINDGRSLSLRQVGKALGISAERVRQLEGVALEKLRASSFAEVLRESV